MKNKLKPDLILIFILVMIGCVLALILFLSKKSGSKAEVRIDGEIVESFLLSEDIEYEINSKNGANLLVIKNGKASIKKASCPDGLCINTGEISLSGQSIVCLPNKVVVEIIGQDESKVDVMTGGRN